MTKLAVNLSMIFTEVPLIERFALAYAHGFKHIEIQFPYELSIAEIQKATADFGMEVASMSASLKPQVKDGESLMTHYDKIVADCKAVGTDLLRIGMLPIDAMASLDKVLEFCHDVNEVTQKLKEDGITLYYHNHHIAL